MLFECPTSVRFPSTLVLVLLLTAAPVHAGIVSTSGAVSIISPPADARLGALENNTVAQLFMEVTGLTLPSSLAVDFNAPGTYNSNPPGPLPTIAAGTIVESYYLITDPVGSDPANIRSFSGTITFSTDVLGVIVLDPEFASVMWRSGIREPCIRAAESVSNWGLQTRLRFRPIEGRSLSAT